MDAIVAVLGKLLAFVKEVWVAVGFEEGVEAIDNIIAQLPAEEA